MSYPNYPTGGYPGGYPAQPGGYPAQPGGYPPQPGGYPAQPGGYPAQPGGYPAQPQQQGGYPYSAAQPNPYPGYPPNPQDSAYPSYPAAGGQAGYPGYPGAGASYGAPTAPLAPSYPSQPQQPYYPAPAPGVPQYQPAPAQPYQPQGYSGVYPPGGPQAPAPGGLYPSVAPYAPSATSNFQQHQMEPNIPTVHPAAPFDPRADADVLHKAMKGLGTDERALINVLCHRTSAQRVQIAQAYKAGYGKDLESKIKSETSGAFEKVLVALVQPPAEYMAREMYQAVSGMGTNEGTLVEILCSGNNQEIRDMNAAYQRLYGHPMEKDIKGDTSGTLKMLLVSLAQGQRDENHIVDINKVKEDAQRLYRAGEAQLGTDESAFNAILVTRSWVHLRQLMAEYQAIRGSSLEKAVASEFSANAEKGLLGILQCAQNRPAFYAQRLHKALSGIGTKDQNLIRILVSRCDVDLGNIKREYEKMFGKSLAADVSGDTSGDYKKALLALIG